MTIMTPHNQRRECAICFSSEYLDNLNSPQRLYSTPCNHHFHFECLHRWCLTNNNCPTCRFDDVMNIPDSNLLNATIRVRRERRDSSIMNNYHYSHSHVISQETNLEPILQNNNDYDLSNNYFNNNNNNNIIIRPINYVPNNDTSTSYYFDRFMNLINRENITTGTTGTTRNTIGIHHIPISTSGDNY